jgi:hypothetical protein
MQLTVPAVAVKSKSLGTAAYCTICSSDSLRTAAYVTSFSSEVRVIPLKL